MAKRISLPRWSAEGIAAELITLLNTITADGVISDAEAFQLRSWLESNRSSELPGLDFLLHTITQALADGKISTDERRAIYFAVEKVLPPETRKGTTERRKVIELLERENGALTRGCSTSG